MIELNRGLIGLAIKMASESNYLVFALSNFPHYHEARAALKRIDKLRVEVLNMIGTTEMEQRKGNK